MDKNNLIICEHMKAQINIALLLIHDFFLLFFLFLS